MYGEVDDPKFPPTGMVCELQINDPLFLELNNRVNKLYKKNKTIIRAYINLFLPNEKPYFHIDGDVRTFLFYINPKVDINENGETQFFLNGEIKGFLPIPGSMVSFDGNILHRATSFRSLPRITVALKYKF